MFIFCNKVYIVMDCKAYIYFFDTRICCVYGSLLALGICLDILVQSTVTSKFHPWNSQVKVLAITLFILDFYLFATCNLFSRPIQIFIYLTYLLFFFFFFWPFELTSIIAVEDLVKLYKAVHIQVKTVIHVYVDKEHLVWVIAHLPFASSTYDREKSIECTCFYVRNINLTQWEFYAVIILLTIVSWI